MLLIKNVKIDNKLTNVMLIGNKVSKIGGNYTFDSSIPEFDGKGGTILPAFVDMHVHLREPGFEYKEDITSGLKAAVAGGFSAVCCMPNTKPQIDNQYIVNYIVTKAKSLKLANVYPIGAITKGLKGDELTEMAAMKREGAVGVSDDGCPVSSANMMRMGMEYAKGQDLIVISHCEDKSLADGYANEGENATKAGLKGISRVSEEMMVAREILLADALKTRVHIAHISTKNSVDLVRWGKAKGINVTCETCPHYFIATDELILNYDGNAKVNPPLRTEEDRQSIIEGIVDGTIDCIVTDHAPHHVSEKETEFALAANGLSGLESSYSLSYTALVKSGIITNQKLSELMTKNPAKIINVPFGALEVDGQADFVIVDNEISYKIDSKKWFSKGKNTPFNGREVSGQILATIVNGRVVYKKS